MNNDWFVDVVEAFVDQEPYEDGSIVMTSTEIRAIVAMIYDIWKVKVTDNIRLEKKQRLEREIAHLKKIMEVEQL